MDPHRSIANNVTPTPAVAPASAPVARGNAIECLACLAAAVGGVCGWYFVGASLMRPATSIARVGLALLAGDGVC